MTRCTSANIACSTDNGVAYSYLPPNDYDAATTDLRVIPSGEMPIAGAGQPSIEVKFRTQTK